MSGMRWDLAGGAARERSLYVGSDCLQLSWVYGSTFELRG